MEPADQLADRLREGVGRIARLVRKQTVSLAQAHGETLSILDRQGAMTIADVARIRGVKHQGQSRTVGELEELGLVARTASAADGRVSVIRATDDGVAAIRRDRAARTRLLASAIDGAFTAEERAVLERVPELLERLAESAED